MARPRPALAALLVGVVLTAAVSVTAAVIRLPRPAAAQPSTAAAGPAPTATEADVRVAPLRRLTAPDVAVGLRRPAGRAAVARLRRTPHVASVTVLDTGRIRVHGRRLSAIGVTPSGVRGLTPALTARSDALWQSVARGELAVAFAAAHRFRHALGAAVTARARHARSLRLGAFASFGIGRAEAVVDHSVARSLGLHAGRRIIVAAPHLSIATIEARVHRLFGPRAAVHRLRPAARPRPVMSDYARATIPSTYLNLYRYAAGTCPGLPWTVLAGIGAVETGHGADLSRSPKGAVGPMQFLPSTFATYGVDGDGDGAADIHDPADAIYSAARYLCLWGGGRGGQSLYDAVFAYNHADWYVREVFTLANAFA